MEAHRLKVKKLSGHALLPRYMSGAAAGLDLASAAQEAIRLEPGQRALIPTGLAIELPPGHEAQVRPRSGLAVRQGLTVLNAPGTIDQDYRGEIKVPLINLGQEPIVVQPGMRIAQMVVAAVTRVVVEEASELSDTNRAEGGFGHTGERL